MGISKKSKLDVTIAVPTYNGEEHLHSLIAAVLSQETELSFELLIIDSGSKDKTLSIIENFPEVRLHKIPNSEFGHGKTRNLAASMSDAEFIVFLSQDAIPAHNKWLEFMIEPFYLSKDVFCVVGKQTPRPFTDATTKREVSSVFNSLGPDHSLMIHRGKSLINKRGLDQKLTFFSDVNSAVKLNYLKKILPYRDVDYSEDQLLGSDVLEAGYLKAFAPQGNVMHSNDYPIRKYFSRRIDEYSAMLKVLNVVPEGRIYSLLKLLILETFRDYSFIIKDKDYSFSQKIRNFVGSPVRNFEKLRASYVVNKNRDNIKDIEKHSLEKKARL